MPPICNICADKKINNNARCSTCKKCLCIECYDRVSKFKIYKNNGVNSEYKCPFCNCIEEQNLQDLSRDVLIRFTETAVINHMGQIKENNKIKEEYMQLRLDFDEMLDKMDRLEMSEYKQRRDAVKYKILQTEIEILKKCGRKTIKMTEIEKLI